MMTCLECNAEVEEGAYVCPKCGGQNLMGAYSPEDALAALGAMKGQSEAAEHVDRSAELYKQKHFDEAIVELNKALEINPKNPTAHGNMGAVLLEQGKPAEAIQWLEKALKLNPNLEGIPAALARAKAEGGAQKSGCFIATACYGNPNSHEVNVLRTYRDKYLYTNVLGRLSIRLYYEYSPAMASWLERHPQIRSTVRKKLLNPLVSHLEKTKGI